MATAREGVTRPGNRTRLTDCFSQFFIYMHYRDSFVDDEQIWQRVVAATSGSYAALPAETRDGLDGLIRGVMILKRELSELALAAGSGAVCRSCGGRCCLNGKYHVTVLDLLAYHSAGVDPVLPDFGKRPLCPYGDEQGCMMAAPFRSMTCLIFNCELVEKRMGANEKQRFADTERSLRRTVEQAEKLLGFRAGRALLLSGGP